MNNKRRSKIKNIIKMINNTKVFYDEKIIDDYIFEDKLEEYCLEISDILYEEQNAYDNMPESLQSSERAYKMEENIDSLDECLDLIDEIIDEYDKEDKKRSFENNFSYLIKTLTSIIESR